MSKETNKNLTSVKIDEHLWDEFKILCVKYKFSFQKLSERAIDLYIQDNEFRKKIHNHKIIEK